MVRWETVGLEPARVSAVGDGAAEGRIRAGGLRELGPVNWALSRIAARVIGAPQMHLFSVLGQNRLLFACWLPFSGALLFGKLRKDTELIILRVAHLRGSDYELQHHRRIARRRGIDTELQEKIFEGPTAAGLTQRQRVLISATDEFVTTRTLTSATWAALSSYLSRAQLIEFCTLVGQYDALAATMAALHMPLDFEAKDG